MEVREYVSAQGRNYFRHWFLSLDLSVRLRVQARIRRLRQGNPGKTRHLGGSLHEAKMDLGPGYRLYYGQRNGKLILLLSGGDKSTQSNDIEIARACWSDYLEGDQ